MSETTRDRLRSVVVSAMVWLAMYSTIAGCEGDEHPVSSAPLDVVEDENPHLWKPVTRTVAVFKNGLAFFSQEGPATLRDGWCHARDIPPAAFGTLAIYSRDAAHTVDIVGTGPGEIFQFDDQHLPADLETKRNYLTASRGLRVRTAYRHRDADREAVGRLISVDQRFAILDDEQQTVAVPIGEMTRLELQDVPLRVHVSRDDASVPDESVLGMAYLRTGLMWIPEYTLQIVDDESAVLTLRGTLVNEAEDLVHCDVQFVVGVPHFAHRELMSPIAVGRAIRSIGTGIPRGDVPSQVMTQMMNRAVVTSNAMRSPQWDSSGRPVPASEDSDDLEWDALLAQLPSLESAAAGDFTVYTKKDLTVRRGERASVTLLTQKVRYRHRYRWETGKSIEHLLLLENRGSTPWTTGPCLAVSGTLPLSEDILKYTPAGGSGELPVTTAINLSHAVTEREIDRQLKAHSPRGNEFYDLVTIEGTVRLKSFEKLPAEIQVTAPVAGRPIEADHDGVIRLDPTKLRLLERAAVIDWHLTLEPGEEVVLHYQYERYVPSH
jgi:hypothetical protein